MMHRSYYMRKNVFVLIIEQFIANDLHECCNRPLVLLNKYVLCEIGRNLSMGADRVYLRHLEQGDIESV